MRQNQHQVHNSRRDLGTTTACRNSIRTALTSTVDLRHRHFLNMEPLLALRRDFQVLARYPLLPFLTIALLQHFPQNPCKSRLRWNKREKHEHATVHDNRTFIILLTRGQISSILNQLTLLFYKLHYRLSL